MKLLKPAARNRGRFVSLSLLALLISWSVQVAHADGVTGKISNGQTVNGTVIGNGFDTYTFKVPAGGDSFVVSLSETGTHDETFVPGITLTGPGTSDGRGSGRPLFTILQKQKAAEGTWSVSVDRKDHGTTGGGYALTLVQLPGAVPASGGITVGALSAGAASSGTNTRGKIDVWTFNGVAGQTKTLTLNQTGGTGFAPEIAVVSPTGGMLAGVSTETSSSLDISIAEGGVYTVLAWKSDDHDVTGAYSLTVNDKN
jgi:hypothetical protein